MMYEKIVIFWQFMWRDVYVHRQRFSSYFINSVIIRPLCLIICLGYVLQKAGMITTSWLPQGSFFAGVPVMYIFSLTVSINFDFLVDFERDRHINFQRMLLTPSWLLLQKILMGTSVLFLCSLPFYPLTKLILGDLFAIEPGGILRAMVVLWCTSWLTTALFYCVASYIHHSNELSFIWRCCIYPLFMLGGSLVPWKVTASVWPSLAAVLLINPYMYVTDGFRQALFDSPIFFSLSVCLCMICLFAVCFTLLSIWLFRRKVDAV
jgi:ABC-2 type transport system permease protein